jgi:hypothetical protein
MVSGRITAMRGRVDETFVDQRLHQLGEVVARQGFDHHGDDRATMTQ